MPIKILMPALSPTMTEGNLVRWLKSEGDTIKAGQVLAEIETDKATMEVEAVDEGILAKILVPAGTEGVKVNSLIALVLEEGEDKSALETIKGDEGLALAPGTEEVSVVTTAVAAPEVAAQLAGERLFASPLARRIADQNNLNLAAIDGSGPRGRIVKADVESFMQAAPKVSAPKEPVAPVYNQSSYVDVSLSGMRKVIAKRLSESKQTIPHFYLTIDCNLEALLKLRGEINARLTMGKLSVNDFIVRAVALSLIKVPAANASWHETHMRQYQAADVCVAVAVDGGLVTPVVRSAEMKPLNQLSIEVKDLAERARLGKLLPEEYQGGSFTISNLGMYGVKQFAAIINPPQAAILAVGVGEQRPVVSNGQLAIATVMSCTLCADHRVIDGAVGAEFLAAFKEFIEDPLRLLI